jgi:hypothetical protein
MTVEQVEILYSEVIEGAADIVELRDKVNRLLRCLGEGKKKPETRLTWLKEEGRMYCIVEWGDYR